MIDAQEVGSLIDMISFRSDVRAIASALLTSNHAGEDNADAIIDRAFYYARLIEFRMKKNSNKTQREVTRMQAVVLACQYFLSNYDKELYLHMNPEQRDAFDTMRIACES